MQNTVNDRLYGDIGFTEPIFQELLNCPSLVRLQGVDMGGHFEVYFPGTRHSRFEHSVGVAWLLRKFGASLEEQVAGLLHDVSHSAFSHAIDYAISANSEATQSYQDDIHVEYIQRTEIPAILAKYGLKVEHILDDARHPLKERDLPDLCADRIDYLLRGAIAYAGMKRGEAETFLEALTIADNRWVFRDYEKARAFAELFRAINHRYYSNIETALMFRTTGDWLAYALKEGYISHAELYTTDKAVIDRINQRLDGDQELRRLWRRMNNQVRYELVSPGTERTVRCKSRMVDPWYREGNDLQRVSMKDSEWRIIVERESQPKAYTIHFLD